MTERAKQGQGRPPKHARSLDDLAMHATLREAKATSRGILDSGDTLMKRITTISPQLRAQIRAGYESTTPVDLIQLFEAASEGLLSPDKAAKAMLELNEQKARVHEARVEGQKKRRLAEKNSQAEITQHPVLQRLIKRLKPAGKLTPNGAASLALHELGSVMPVADMPSHRTLRRLFTEERIKLLATQRP